MQTDFVFQKSKLRIIISKNSVGEKSSGVFEDSRLKDVSEGVQAIEDFFVAIAKGSKLHRR